MSCSSSFQVISAELDNNSDRLMESTLPATEAQVNDVLLDSFLSDVLSVYTDSSCSNSPLSSDEDFYSTTSSSGRKRPARYPLGSPKRFKDDDFLVIDGLVPPSPESGISMSSPKAVSATQSSCCRVWLEVLEQPEEHYRARYASEGSRGPLKGRSQNSYPKVKVMVEGLEQHISAVISVSLVHHDSTVHGVCSLSGSDDEHLYNSRLTNLTKRVTFPDMSTEFDQLRIKRERNLSGRGRQKQKSQKYDESVGYLLFQAEIATVNGNVQCSAISQPIKLTAKVECAELHAIKNECGSVEGGDEVWIRGSKMIGNPTVLFEIVDQATNRLKSFPGLVVKEECHQNLLVVKTPKIPYNEQVQSQVVVVTGKDKLRSNSLPFLFVPAHICTPYFKSYSPSPPPFVPKMATLSPSYSPQPRTPPFVDVFANMTSSPAAIDFRQTLDECAYQLNSKAEEEILAVVDSLPMQGTTQSYEPSNKTTYP